MFEVLKGIVVFALVIAGLFLADYVWNLFIETVIAPLIPFAMAGGGIYLIYRIFRKPADNLPV